jgi:hypothetical protein
MTRSGRREKLETLPLREELDTLAHHYHHLQNEHERARPESAVRRVLEDRLLEVRDRLDRVLEEWVSDEELRNEWRAYLHNHRSDPSGPPAIRPLAFQGRSDAGSIAEIRRKDDELEVEVDGALVERIVGDKDFSVDRPVFRFRLNGTEFEETFSASPAALRALADFRDQGSPPPWEHASELLADGLIDVHFDLTPRGRRAVARLESEE